MSIFTQNGEKFNLEEVAASKIGISRFGKAMGLVPHFYTEDDKDRFDRQVSICDPKKVFSYNLETLYTWHKPMHIPPSEHSVRSEDTYGIMRLNLWETLIKNNISNVKSCHRIADDGDAIHCGGNLGYLTNPAWAAYAIYGNPDSSARFAHMPPGFNNADIKHLPNLLAIVNAYMCRSTTGRLTIVLSRVYGTLNAGLDKLIDYFDYQGADVYQYSAWSDKTLFKNPLHSQGYDRVLDDAGFNNLAQITQGEKVAFRYQDIPKPLVSVSANSVLSSGDLLLIREPLSANVGQAESYKRFKELSKPRSNHIISLCLQEEDVNRTPELCAGERALKQRVTCCGCNHNLPNLRESYDVNRYIKGVGYFCQKCKSNQEIESYHAKKDKRPTVDKVVDITSDQILRELQELNR